MKQHQKIVENILLWAVRIGLWIIPILPFYVSSSMLFPFITGKNFAFRIIIELVAPLWIGLAIMRQEFRPRLTIVVKAVTALMIVLFFADIFGANPYRSFFSNYERMEGFISFAHLYLYFLMLVSVFRVRRDWLIFFHVSIATSIAVSYIGLLQRLGYRTSLQGGFRVDATIGNPTYLAAYLLFHLWLLGLLIKQFWPARPDDHSDGSRAHKNIKRWILMAVYMVIFLFELAIIYFTATRGVVLALLAAAVPFLAAVVLFWHNMFSWSARGAGSTHASRQRWTRGRMIAGIAFALIVIVPASFWLARSSRFIQESQVLNRLTNYSLSEATVGSRFLIWKMSLKGALERPMLGWGQENYYLVFQKYFEPGLYGQEPWFDRSHNIIFDWLNQAGFIGLAVYLGVFGSVFWMIARSLRKKELLLWEGLILLCLFISYFLQNIFVFDNLNTYLLFFAFLAYAQYLVYAREPVNGSSHHQKIHQKTGRSSHQLYQRGLAGGAVLFAASLVSMYVFNIRAMKESQALIRSLQVVQARAPIDDIIKQFQTALSYGTFGDTEVREQIGNAARGIVGNQQFNPDDQKKIAEFAAEVLKKETSRPAKDIKHLLFLSSILDRALQINPAYAGESEQILLEALKLSPTKQITYFELAQLYLATNHPDQAIALLKKAWDLEPRFIQAGINLEIIGLLTANKEAVAEVQAKIDHNTLDEQSIYRLALTYQQTQDFASALTLYSRLITINPNNAQYHATYAALLGFFDRIEEAEREVNKAAQLDANFAKESEQFLKMLRDGQKK